MNPAVATATSTPVSHPALRRTRIKMCGLTREADVEAAVAAGADAIGFVMYEKSPRHVNPERAKALAQRLPPFVTPVCLFVNASVQTVRETVATVGSALVQLHGDESPEYAAALGLPHMRAARVPLGLEGQGFNLLEFGKLHASANGILLDALIDGYGGGGKTFDWTAFHWSQLPPSVSSRLVLSGGLTPANVTDGICQVRPWAVDVSSGIEQDDANGKPLRGIKDPKKMWQFVQAVREADATLNATHVARVTPAG